MSEHTTKPNVEYLLNYLRANEDDVADSFPCGIEDLEQPMTILAAAPDLLDACRHVRDNLVQESTEVWEIEIACLNNAITKAETGR